jgi:hypothetical protein
MDPKEFTWSEEQHVTVTNPTANDYIFKVHGKEYKLGAGRTAKMPGFIAWVYVYGLSTQIAQADGVFNRWNEEGFRQEYYDKLVVGAEDIVQDVVVAPQPEVHVFDEDSNKAKVAPQISTATDEEEGEEPEQEVKAQSPKAKNANAAKV